MHFHGGRSVFEFYCSFGDRDNYDSMSVADFAKLARDCALGAGAAPGGGGGSGRALAPGVRLPIPKRPPLLDY